MELKPLWNTEYYYLSDHLGSIRVVLKEDGNVESWSDYYPFGKESRGNSTSNEPKEQFTGKERDIEIGLDYFGARYYNADVGRWTSRDPLAEKYPGFSPYNYSLNNPVNYFDPDGKYVVAHDGSTVSRISITSASIQTFAGLIPGMNVFTTILKAGWNDPSYPMGWKDYVGLFIGGGCRLGGKVASKMAFTTKEKEAIMLQSKSIGKGTEVYFSLTDFVDAQQLYYDEAVFAAAEDAGLGKNNEDKAVFEVNTDIGKAGKNEVTRAFKEVSEKLDKVAKDKFNLKSKEGVQQFKGWLKKNKGAFKKNTEEKTNEKEKDKEE